MTSCRIDIYVDTNEHLNGSSPGCCLSECVKFKTPYANVESLYTGSDFCMSLNTAAVMGASQRPACFGN